MDTVIQALLLSTFAGLSTGVGSIIAYFFKEPKKSYLSIFTGFAAGVMIYVSFVELLGTAIAEIGFALANSVFFFGIVLIYILDKFIPHAHMDSELDSFHSSIDQKRVHQTGVLAAVGIALHNFPEGMAVFAVSLESISLGVPIALAIAIHNIPEGIAVSVPIYFSTGDRKKAFIYSFFSGLAEPMGALISFIFLMPFLNKMVINIALAGVAGVMVFISFDELLPISREYGNEHLSSMGLFLGMFVMMLSFIVF